jgi:hypothetical protein
MACRGRRSWRPSRLEIVVTVAVAVAAYATGQWTWLLLWLVLDALFLTQAQLKATLSITEDAVVQANTLVELRMARAQIVEVCAVGNKWIGRRLVLRGPVDVSHRRWSTRKERRTMMQIADIYDCPLDAIEAALRRTAN